MRNQYLNLSLVGVCFNEIFSELYVANSERLRVSLSERVKQLLCTNTANALKSLQCNGSNYQDVNRNASVSECNTVSQCRSVVTFLATHRVRLRWGCQVVRESRVYSMSRVCMYVPMYVYLCVCILVLSEYSISASTKYIR